MTNQVERKRMELFDKYKREVAELTEKATGKRGLISFYKNETELFQRADGSWDWTHCYASKRHLPLIKYFTKRKLQLFERYMPDYDDFVLKYYNICADLEREATTELWGSPETRGKGSERHYYPGCLLTCILKLTEQHDLLHEAIFSDSVCEKNANKVRVLTNILPRDIVNVVQSFLWPKYAYIL